VLDVSLFAKNGIHVKIREYAAGGVTAMSHVPSCKHPSGEWQKQMIQQDFDPVTSTTAQFVCFCELVE
jgi:hypothetical protein